MVYVTLKLLLVLNVISILSAKQPHILLIVADDYGWNDIGYHGSKEVKTPNLDQLAAYGIKLENYYVQPICTPTRSQLLSGKYQIHTGLQHGIIRPCQPNGLPLQDPTIADQLKSLGYATHAVGKWHVGFYKKEYTPLYRGFDTHFGFLGGSEDYYNHSRCASGFCGIDLQQNGKPTSDFTGHYSTGLFTKKAEKVIDKHNSSQPFFMYLAYQAVHGPNEAPKRYLKQFKHIDDRIRRIYVAMVAAMDEGIGNITAALKRNNMWEDTLIIFTTDNGGTQQHGGNNYPLRGKKATHWEGGIRGVGFLTGPLIKNKGEISHQLLHVSDWYPTIVSLAGGNTSNVKGLDGFDQWRVITENSTNPRDEILVNIDPMAPKKGKTISAVFDTSVKSALRQGDWKIITGDPGFDKWVPEPTDRDSITFYELEEEDKTSIWSTFWEQAIHAYDWIINWSRPVRHHKLFHSKRQDTKNVYLFNIAEDPEERNEVSSQYPEIVDLLLKRLAFYNSTAVPVNYPDTDKRCDPSKRGGFWGPWIENERSSWLERFKEAFGLIW